MKTPEELWKEGSATEAFVAKFNEVIAQRDAATRDNAILAERLTAAELKRDENGEELERARVTIERLKGEIEVLKNGVAQNTALRAALESQIKWWESVPSGVDYDADPNNECPLDSTAHIAGLAIREIQAALAKEGGK